MKKLIEADIQHWTGVASFGRGQSYFCRGRISHPRRQGNTFKADCQSSRAAETDYPRQALDIYLKRINPLIEARGRDNYALAAKYLLRVRELYHRLGEEANWEKLITTILVKNRQLRALKEELTKVGLS